MNISIGDLFKWNAVIEMIDLYEKYLLLPNLVNENESYCQCSSLSQFGRFCQYTIADINFNADSDQQSFSRLVHGVRRQSHTNEKMETKYVTCYVGISCETNLLCLDWRQICNGIIDCNQGEDEPFDLCLQMESNQCNTQTEFRCKNGLCIENSFTYDRQVDCLDGSDIMPYANWYKNLCFQSMSFNCEEMNYQWKSFSCGNGYFIPYSKLTSKSTRMGVTCHNKRDVMFLKQIFSLYNENLCWKSMICLIGFDYLYSNLTCLNQINVEESCPDEFYFPPNSMIYSFVFFLYEKSNRTNWFDYSGPNYICYNETICPKKISKLPTIVKNNLTCFYVDQRVFSWENFYEYIIYLFRPCFSNYQSSLFDDNKMLYQCELSNELISINRVKDRNKDCYWNEDEYSNINLCSFTLVDQFTCLTNKSDCVRWEFIGDEQYDCVDGSDEYKVDQSLDCHTKECIFHRDRKIEPPLLLNFDQLCDNIVNRFLFPSQTNETDETDCEYWPYTCKSVYTRCNQVWNCKNGEDEVNCPSKCDGSESIHRSFGCEIDEHYCIQLTNNDIKKTCIHINRSGDGIIDCIGGTDERLTNICVEKYPFNRKRRFNCMNSSVCINLDQVCDTIIDCPFEDDERVCPWLFQSNSSKFHCENSPSLPRDRCIRRSVGEFSLECRSREHFWFCDLEMENQVCEDQLMTLIPAYPKITRKMKLISFENPDLDNDLWLCNQGYPIQSFTSNKKFYCLCSPSYYGDYCQYQSERLTVYIEAHIAHYFNPLTVFRLIIYLLNENHTIISHDEMIFNNKAKESNRKFRVYLLYERIQNTSLYQRLKSKFVRIDSYRIELTNVQYISSYFFSVPFSFLPVNRLAVTVTLQDQLLKISNCKKRCSSHGKCMQYENFEKREYCWCQQGWFGDQCLLKSSFNLCNQTSCSPHSQCMILNDQRKQIKCICPLGKSGNQCYIKHNPCLNNLCQNNGTCLPLDQRSFSYKCICDDEHYGDYCQTYAPIWYISISTNISELPKIPIIIVIIGTTWLQGVRQKRYLHKDVLLPTSFKVSDGVLFVFIQMFPNSSKSLYYLVRLQSQGRQILNTSVISASLCPNVSELFNKTILNEYSYLKRLKLYHLPCQQNKDLLCFFDEYRMCLCTKDHNSDCHLFYHEYGNCNHCSNDGLCITGDSTNNPWDYTCLCLECSFGSLCQFSIKNYFITIDILIGIEIKSGNNSFSNQPFIIQITLIIFTIILCLSFLFNTINLIIFSNKKLRQVGCDLYLFNLTIISQIGLIFVCLRYLYTLLIQMYLIENVRLIKILCQLFEYFSRLFPSVFDWLTVCISIERTYTLIKDVHFTKRSALKTLKISRWISFIVLLFNGLLTLHRPFYFELVDEPTINGGKQGHPWCILDFKSTSWDSYEKFINIFQLIIPMILNLGSILFFLLYKIKHELTILRKNYQRNRLFILKEQILKYKLLIISPIVISILEIPRLILTFVLSCIQYKWQRYIYLISYIISFLPLTAILFIYVMPSPKYSKEFKSNLRRKIIK
ncbi:unnamed protein product [Adineta ricciae]|nr:unnamed protein product [Adineta ricciae]